MATFHEHLVDQLDRKLRAHRIVVWYDRRSEFADFFDELKPLVPPEGRGGLPRFWVGDLQTHIVRYDGSFFALKERIEPIAELDEPEPLLVYVPGVRQDRQQSVLMEVEKGGASQEWDLRKQARTALRSRYTDGEIDEMLDPEGVGYRDIARFLSNESGGSGSLLKLALGEGSSDVLLSRWLVGEDRDTLIVEKGATHELFKLVLTRLGLNVAAESTLAQARHQVVRYVLVNEFRHDLTTAPPEQLEGVLTPSTQDEHRRIHEVANTIRREGDRYVQLADGIERELKLSELALDAATLGSIDTFRFEEVQLLTHAANLVVGAEFGAARGIVDGRGRSFWLDRDVGRRTQWEACRLAADLGQEVQRVRPLVKKTSGGTERWIESYAAPGGWFEVDRAQRSLEAWVASMDDDPEDRLEQAINLVRRDHETLLKEMAAGYSAALVAGKWNVPDVVLHQTRIYPELVEKAGGRVAYFFVDAMRYEMGAELAQLLEDAEDLSLVAAAVALPSITHVGMAALLPGASASFSVVEHKGKLASKIDDTIMPGLSERQRFVKSRAPHAKDLGMGTLLTKSTRQLAKAVGDAPLLIVRSQSIDKTGETDGGYMARQIMDAVLGNVARAVRKLAKLGVEYFVITADHGHQFTVRKEADMHMDKPMGETIEQHRRAWAGRGGQTSGASVRVSGAELGYDTDLDFIFPTGLAVFKAGGDLAFHHGGISLQEMVVPVLSLRMPVAGAQTTDPTSVFLDEHPETITNRMFSLRVTATQLLGDAPVALRLVLVESRPNNGAIAGKLGMAVGAESFDRATGIVRLLPNTAAQVGIMLANADAECVRIVAQDPHTDAVLSQTEELPVKLGI